MVKLFIKEKEVLVKEKTFVFECSLCGRSFMDNTYAERHRDLHMSLREAITLLLDGKTLCLYANDRFESEERDSSPKLFVKFENDSFMFLAGSFWNMKSKEELYSILLNEYRLCEILDGEKLKDAHKNTFVNNSIMGPNGSYIYNRCV
jgi:hypothetical protein